MDATELLNYYTAKLEWVSDIQEKADMAVEIQSVLIEMEDSNANCTVELTDLAEFGEDDDNTSLRFAIPQKFVREMLSAAYQELVAAVAEEYARELKKV